jgi:hypothetical protein
MFIKDQLTQLSAVVPFRKKVGRGRVTSSTA